MSALDSIESILEIMELDKTSVDENFIVFNGPEIRIYQNGHQLRMCREAWVELGRPETVTIRVTTRRETR